MTAKIDRHLKLVIIKIEGGLGKHFSRKIVGILNLFLG